MATNEKFIRPYRVLEKSSLADVVFAALDGAIDDDTLNSVCDLLEDDNVFVFVDDVEARNAEHARRLAAEQIETVELREVELTAIAHSNWNGEVRMLETKTVSR